MDRISVGRSRVGSWDRTVIQSNVVVKDLNDGNLRAGELLYMKKRGFVRFFLYSLFVLYHCVRIPVLRSTDLDLGPTTK